MNDGERQLIRRAQKGEHEAFLALLALHDRQIMSVIYRFSGNLYDREDLYQEVFMHCFRSIRQFRFRSAFATWLYRLAMNRCVAYMRTKRPAALEESDGRAPPVNRESLEKLGAVRRALSRLKGPQQICFHMHYIEGWSVDTIAEMLGCREGTVKSHLNRARSKIRTDHEVLAWQSNP